MRLFLVALCLCAVNARLRSEPLASSSCTTYSCGTLADSSTCISNSTGAVTIQPCQGGMVCNTQTGSCQPASPPQQHPGWPGEPCSQMNPCAYGQCSNGVCVGVQAGGACQSHDWCDPGLMCNSNNVCTTLTQIGGVGCISDFGCTYGSFCNKTYYQTTGTCVQMGKVPLGGYVTDCNNTFSWMCGTNTCTVVDFDMMLGYCSPALLSTSPVPTGCSTDTACVATDGVSFFTGTCECGMNMLGHSFCTPFLGDVPGVTYRMTMNLAYVRAQRCNTVRRYSDACFNATGTLARVKSARFGYFNFPLVQENQNCVKMIFTSDYWLSGVSLQVMLAALLVASSL